ncbi:MAG: LysR family transcriptional regulator [Pseudomonadota bacterium]
MSINLKQLEAFIAVADLGGFRRAAERLNTTQPNISTRIASVERILGVTLMERDAGSVRLTAQGKTLLPRARKVIREFDAFIGAAGNDALYQGIMRLGVTEMITHAWLGRFMKAVQTRFPNIQLELSVDLSVNISDALIARNIDLAIQNGPFDQDTTGMIDLGSYPLIWVASPALGLGGRSRSLSDLCSFTILTHAKGALPHEQLLKHLWDNGASHTRLATSTNLAACLQMAVDGLGVSCLPQIMVTRDLAEGRLEPVRYDWKPDSLCFAARFDAETAPSYVLAAADLAKTISSAAG